uniref:Calcium-transporting ATPase n=1 Tax=Clastoptera arizonana TaxID=38151 RepID=A0A1B6CSF5_9HEMI
MIYSGTHVMQGSGKMVVTAVGIHSQAGIIYTLLNSVHPNEKNKNERNIGNYAKEKTVEIKVVNADLYLSEQSSSEVITNSRDEQVNEAKKLQFESNNIRKQRKSILQNKLTKLSIVIGTVGAIIAAITFIILVLQFCIKKFVVDKLEWESSDMNQIVHFFIVGVTLLVVVIPEGLPLAVTISLAYSVKKMMKDNNLVRHLDACETMGNATTICSDKTGTLTTNKMTVVASYICGNFFTTVPEFSSIPENVGEYIIKAISINTCYTSRVVLSPLAGKHGTQIGNKTDCALLGFVTALGKNYQEIREQYPEKIFAHVYPFNSIRKSMSTIVPVAEEKGYHLFIKGASEVLLKKCSYCYGKNGEIITFTNEMQKEFESSVIKPMACDGLRTILLAHRDFVYNKESINQEQISPELDWKNEQDICDNLTLLCVVGIEDPVRPEVPAVMKKCQRAGIIVRMITGDNIITATSIALKCGIINYGDKYYVFDSNEFNKRIRDPDGKIQQDLLDKVWPNLRVLARSTPTDKYVLVKGIMNSKIKVDREVVAVTGDGTNDAPALMEADVGFAMGITGTDVAKDASDIIITDDSFISIVKAIMWGRNIYDNIAKFLQFQLTVNVVAVIVTFTGACTIKDSPLRAVQMLWVNLIMDTLASLALATEAPTAKLLLRKPYGSSKFLISRTMFKNIIAQSIYQISVELFLLFYGDIMMDIPSGTNFKTSPTQHHTIIFNAFVMMTLFNEINSRSVHDHHNIFEGLFKNYIFCTIWIVSFVLQTLFIEFGQSIFWTSSLTLDQWLWCIFFGIGSLLWCQLSSCIHVNKVPRFLIWGKEDLITGEEARSSILWARGKSRLQYQLDVIQAFRESVDTNLV